MSFDIIYDYMEANPDDPFGGPDEILAWADKELATLREQVKVLREALGKIADATIEGIDGDEWFNDIANTALVQTTPKDGE